MVKFFNDIFALNLKDYANIGIDLKINILIAISAFAISLFGFIMGNYRATLSGVMKQFLRHGAIGEANAKSLKDLGLYNSRGARRALSGDTRLKGTVARVGEKKLTYEEYMSLSKKDRKNAFSGVDFDTALFYIEEENKERAEYIYKNYDTSPLKSALGALLLIAVAFVLMIFMPEILTLINNALA